ncbi:MAG: adenylosuccinate lyase, partial [Ottowia sp.]|nr:adenylosuccinate lyase [Ottowia sp.]
MNTLSPLTAISPLDGRYAAKLDALRPITSEYGLIKRRVLVEITWFIALSDAGFAEFPPLPQEERDWLQQLAANFSVDDAAAIKEHERTTNHDVKAVEYWLRERFAARPALAPYLEFIHFACTSEDINNVCHALQARDARAVLLEAMDAALARLRQLAGDWAAQPML